MPTSACPLLYSKNAEIAPHSAKTQILPWVDEAHSGVLLLHPVRLELLAAFLGVCVHAALTIQRMFYSIASQESQASHRELHNQLVITSSYGI